MLNFTEMVFILRAGNVLIWNRKNTGGNFTPREGWTVNEYNTDSFSESSSENISEVK